MNYGMIKLKMKALNAAREAMENGHALTLCSALRWANTEYGQGNIAYRVAVEDLIAYIRRELKRHNVLESWLKAKKMDYGYAAAFDARIKWIEWMWLCLKEDKEKMEGVMQGVKNG
jgi:hypothetical protein